MNNGNVHLMFLVVPVIAATIAAIKYTASPPSKDNRMGSIKGEDYAYEYTNNKE